MFEPCRRRRPASVSRADRPRRDAHGAVALCWRPSSGSIKSRAMLPHPRPRFGEVENARAAADACSARWRTACERKLTPVITAARRFHEHGRVEPQSVNALRGRGLERSDYPRAPSLGREPDVPACAIPASVAATSPPGHLPRPGRPVRRRSCRRERPAPSPQDDRRSIEKTARSRQQVLSAEPQDLMPTRRPVTQRISSTSQMVTCTVRLRRHYVRLRHGRLKRPQYVVWQVLPAPPEASARLAEGARARRR